MQPQTDGDGPTPPRGADASSPLADMSNARRKQLVVRRDETTRFLCAAMHLNAELADDAIREFLVEPTRAVAPSPGVDSWQVLNQAVAARTRGEVRDGVLSSLALLSLFLLVTSLAGASGSLFAVFIVLLLVMLVVLIIDEVIVWRLITDQFGAGSAPGGEAGGRWAGQSQNTRSVKFAAGLARYQSDTGEQVDSTHTPVIVYRGYHPFVGAGTEFQPWSMAIPLERPGNKEDDTGGQETGTATRLTTDVLYRSVREEIEKLKRATPLSPSRRLAELRILDQVVVPAEELVDHYLAEDEQAKQYLPGLNGAPARFVSREQADVVAANSEEWARYYLCLQIETWDRDLVMSIFIHFAMDDETLYIEWTPCVLFPIKQSYRRIDGWPPSSATPVVKAIAEWVRLPRTIFSRLARVFSSMSTPPYDGVRRVDPDKYGARRSLREMAASGGVHNYFQLLDIERYRKIVQSQFNRTVGRILDEHGYSSQLFRRQVATTTNNFLGGNFAGPIVTGGNVGNTSGGTINNDGPGA